MEKKLIRKISKTRWEYGLNPQSFYIFVYDDGSKEYLWDTYHYQRNFIDVNEYWFKFYWNFVRMPRIRTGEEAYLSDTYELRIENYDNGTGKIIRQWNTRKYN